MENVDEPDGDEPDGEEPDNDEPDGNHEAIMNYLLDNGSLIYCTELMSDCIATKSLSMGLALLARGYDDTSSKVTIIA